MLGCWDSRVELGLWRKEAWMEEPHALHHRSGNLFCGQARNAVKIFRITKL